MAAAVVLAPWARPGALLVRDLVAVSDPAWSTALLGGAERLPRDVPGEALAALAGQLAPGDLVVRVVLLTALVALGAGAGRLVGRGGWPAAVAGLVAVWNPYVLARLHQGQWLVVVALAAVPWVVVHVADGDLPRLARTLVLAGTAGFLAPLVTGPTLVAVGVATRRWRALAVGTGVLALTALPWVLVADPVVGDPDAVRAFAPSADLPAGVLPSLLSGGGYFNTAVASPWRARWVVALMALGLTGLAAWGAVAWVRAGSASARPERRARVGLVVVGATVVLLVAAGATDAGQRLLILVADAVPPTTALRDSQRLLAPWVVVLAVGAGTAAHLLGERASEHGLVGVTLAVLAVVALPDPLLGPRLPRPVDLPDAWEQAATAIAVDPAPVLVVPHGQTQQYTFTDGRPVAVPLRRMVASPVLVDTRLVVGTDDGPLVVEDRDGGEVERRLAEAWPDVAGSELAAAGIGWVAVTDTERTGPAPPGTTVVLTDPTLELLEVTGVAPMPREAGPTEAVLVVDVLVAATSLVLLVLPLGRPVSRPPRVRRADVVHGRRSGNADGG